MTPATAIENESLDEYVQEVDDCPRCGGNHGAQVFRRLSRPAYFGGLAFEFWATCESTGEPLLAHVPEVNPP